MKEKPSILIHQESEEKAKQRWVGVEFIQHAGRLLQIEQATIACAVFYFHQFYSGYSFSDFEKHNIATACLFLACKSEENARRLRDIINVMQKVRNPKEQPLDIQSSRFTKYKELITKNEQNVLRGLSFETSVDHPYKYLLNIAHSLENTSRSNIEREMKGIIQLAWTLLNDMLKLRAITIYKGLEIGVALLYIAAHMMHIQIDPPNWYKNYGVEKKTIVEISNIMTTMYKAPLVSIQHH
mmetsp:Transcript_12335/g.18421  ORF Transcript_12335/g.18421 Transcript_12335/m.18421 type:complete len:240 (+) Transcript_12335:14-733(+)